MISADAFRGAVGDGIPTPEAGDADGWYTSRGLDAGDGHLGEDWNTDPGNNNPPEEGREVHSIAAGFIDHVGAVNASDPKNGWGNYVVVRHPLAHAITINGDTFSTVYSIYGHLKDKVALKVGSAVQSGDVIGKVGNTGNSTSTHLHLGISTSSTFIYKAGAVSDLESLNVGGEFSSDSKYYMFKDGKSSEYFISPSAFTEFYNSGETWAENKDDSSGFSPLAYAANNPDLAGLLSGGSDSLIQHYITYGRTEGRTTAGFDATAYAANNPDLYRAFGLNQNSLLSHYINYGKQEGRKATGFSTYAYAANNKDLQSAYGTNSKALVSHYIAYGQAEGRVATGFDPYAYAAKTAIC